MRPERDTHSKVAGDGGAGKPGAGAGTGTPPWIRFANGCGLVGIILIVTGMLASGVAYAGTEGQSYRMANHFVSELGERPVSDLAWAFNGGLLAGGVGIVVFVAGLVGRMRGWFRWIVAPVGMVTGVFATLVGAFPMDVGRAHIVVANGFFYPGLVTMLLYSLYVLGSTHRELPRWVAAPGLAAAGSLVAFLFLGPTLGRLIGATGEGAGFGPARPDIWVLALLEWVAIGAVLAWVATVAAILMSRDIRSGRSVAARRR